MKFFLKHTLLKVLACGILLTIACILFFIQEGIVGNLIARNCASMIFVLLVLICLHKFSIGNAASFWCGKHSYEIFLFHPLWIGVLRPWINDDVLYAVAVIGVTLFSSFIYRRIAFLHLLN